MAPPRDTDTAIFDAARQISDSGERDAFVRQECGGNSALLERIRRLLQADEDRDELLDQTESHGMLDVTGPQSASHDAGGVIGPYKLREPIGEGGMGTVYVAEQEKPVRRKVALKIIKAGMDTKDVIARFEAERQALALMEHPNIAHVLDAGSTNAGRPYFVMELVSGIPITEYCDQQKLTIRQRLELFIKVCQAIQHAHQKGIIHRDIKPSNVLVTEHDGVPVPKVIDFGVAKAIGQKLTDKTLYTHHLQPVGTLQYMSPEQSRLSGLDIDTRSDVYSLGLLLYELLTGTLPFDRGSFDEASFDEKRRIIAEDEVPKPSKRISSLGQATTVVTTSRQTDIEGLARELRGEIDWILNKSLDKDRNRRYESADRLAEDVQNHLSGDIVNARPLSVGYRLSKAWHRNKVALLLLAGLSIGLVVALSGWYHSIEVSRQQTETLDGIRDFAMLLARSGTPKDLEQAKRISVLSGESEAWFIMLDAQSMYARGEYDAVARLLEKSLDRGLEEHLLARKAMLAFSYIITGRSEDHLRLLREIRDQPPSTAIDEVFKGQALVTDSDQWWRHANKAIDRRESLLALHNRAAAAGHYAVETGNLAIAEIGFADVKRVRDVIGNTPDLFAVVMPLHLARISIMRRQGRDVTSAVDESEREIDLFHDQIPVGIGQILLAWHRDMNGSREESNQAWMEVLEAGGKGWHRYHAAAMLYRDDARTDDARTLLSGDESLEQIALASVLSLKVNNHRDCLKIYKSLSARRENPTFHSGMPLNIPLVMGDLETLRRDAIEMLRSSASIEPLEQAMLELFAGQIDADTAQSRISKLSPSHQMMGNLAIGRWYLAQPEPQLDAAKVYLQRAADSAIFRIGDFYWAKAHLDIIERGHHD